MEGFRLVPNLDTRSIILVRNCGDVVKALRVKREICLMSVSSSNGQDFFSLAYPIEKFRR
jgi:hypothetical protein